MLSDDAVPGPDTARQDGAPVTYDDTWLVVPLYNEAEVIHDVVTHARETFPNIVCVDDGSVDDSGARATAAGAVVVSHPINLGQGAAIQTGIEFALRRPSCRYVVTFDSDGQHRTEDAAAMVDRLRKDEADVVFGSRFLDGRTKPGLMKKLVLKTAIAFSNATSGVHLTDTHNGLRAFNRTGAAALSIKQNRMAHASEIVDQVGKAGLRYTEQPVHILYTDYSRKKGQSLLNSVNILTELLYK
ncbi:glycosyl transferase [Cellulomonas cellasea]|uniref:Glycosyl transferase n=1 Tax=Cellulomonas cellasea TaxID=43670 RepID=A0A4Y3KZN3_9CELL|nr:glycosyl transferase [Cellulomonas cellasea]